MSLLGFRASDKHTKTLKLLKSNCIKNNKLRYGVVHVRSYCEKCERNLWTTMEKLESSKT